MYENENVIKQKIFEASKDVFRRYGYAKVSMDDIAKTSGMARSSLYYYYKNKKEVFRDVVIGECSDVLQIAIRKGSKDKTLEENFINYNLARINQLSLKIKEYNHIILDLRKDTDSLYYFKEVVRKTEEVVLKQILLWSIANNEIPEISVTDYDFFITGITDAFSVFDFELVLFGKVEKAGSRIKKQAEILIAWLLATLNKKKDKRV